jgi:uncharacterized protein
MLVMKRALSTGQPAVPTDLPLDANLVEDSFPDPPVEETQSEPALFNRTAANPSMEMVDEVNRPSTPVDIHSAPEKSDSSSSASSAATIATKDDEITLLKKAADQGYANAQFAMGLMYYKSEGVEVNKAEAAKWFHKAADQGHANAQFNLGLMYYTGEGVELNKAEAPKWFHKAADQGHAKAQFNLGFTYQKGEGVEVNKAEAAKWYHKAAEQGDANAQFNTGVMYQKGEGVEVNKTEAAKWYHKAADQGHAKAQCNLAIMNYRGEGVEVNKAETAKWYHKAADQGQAEAQCNLATMYYKGEGVEVNKAEAAKRYQKAAEQGYAVAQRSVSLCYREGMGVEKDLLLATYWRIKSVLTSKDDAFKLHEDDELIKLIPSVMEKYSEFKRIEKIGLSTGSYFSQKHTETAANFIRSNHKVRSLLIHSNVTQINEDQLSAFVEALKFNTNLTLLEFPKSKLSIEIKAQIEVLLTQNRNIVELRQYVKKHLLIFTADIPIDVVKILDKNIIVSYLKSGQTKEATKKAIDEFLLIARTTPLAKDSKIT